MGDRKVRTARKRGLALLPGAPAIDPLPYFAHAARTMDPRQVDLIRDSFVRVLLEPERAARLFYDRLFELAPDTSKLFRRDMTDQGARLVDALARIVTALTRFDDVRPELCKLAIRHVGYGVLDHHYAAAGKALLHMVAELSDRPLDRATRDAWLMAYAVVSDTMIDASRSARALSDAA